MVEYDIIIMCRDCGEEITNFAYREAIDEAIRSGTLDLKAVIYDMIESTIHEHNIDSHK